MQWEGDFCSALAFSPRGRLGQALAVHVRLRVGPGRSPLAQLLQGPTSAQAQVIAQKLQLLASPPDEAHLLHVLIQRGVHQLQVDEGLGPDVRQELQSLPADLGHRVGQNGLSVSTSATGTLTQPTTAVLGKWSHLHCTDEETGVWRRSDLAWVHSS